MATSRLNRKRKRDDSTLAADSKYTTEDSAHHSASSSSTIRTSNPSPIPRRILHLNLKAMMNASRPLGISDAKTDREMTENAFVEKLKEIQTELKEEREEQLFRINKQGRAIPPHRTSVVLNANQFVTDNLKPEVIDAIAAFINDDSVFISEADFSHCHLASLKNTISLFTALTQKSSLNRLSFAATKFNSDQFRDFTILFFKHHTQRKITHFELDLSRIKFSLLAINLQTLEAMFSIQTLVLAYAIFTAKQFNILLTQLQKSPSLLHLDLSHMALHSDQRENSDEKTDTTEFAEPIAGLLQYNESLVSLCMKSICWRRTQKTRTQLQIAFPEETVATLLKAVSENPNSSLETLKIDYSSPATSRGNRKDPAMQSCASLLRNNRKLRILDLHPDVSQNNFTDASPLFEALSAPSTPSDAKIETLAIAPSSVADVKTTNTTLEILRLTKQNLTPLEGTRLARMLADNQTLTELDLGKVAKIEAPILAMIINALQLNKSIKTLSLEGSSLTHELHQRLVKILDTFNHTLVHLYVTGNPQPQDYEDPPFLRRNIPATLNKQLGKALARNHSLDNNPRETARYQFFRHVAVATSFRRANAHHPLKHSILAILPQIMTLIDDTPPEVEDRYPPMPTTPRPG